MAALILSSDSQKHGIEVLLYTFFDGWLGLAECRPSIERYRFLLYRMASASPSIPSG